MACYTMELRTILYSLMENQTSDNTLGYENIDKVINATWEKFFDFDFPTWDNGKEEICKHILEDYFFREIGYSTVGRFKAAIKQRLRDIMPYYVEMYETTQYKYDVTKPMDYTREFTGERIDDRSNVIDTNNDGSTTNYGRGYDDDSDKTLRGSVDNTNTGKTSQTDNTVSDTKNTERVSGKSDNQSFASIIKEERENIINILQMISEELGNLFMGVW